MNLMSLFNIIMLQGRMGQGECIYSVFVYVCQKETICSAICVLFQI